MENTMDKIDIHSHILYGIDDGSKTLEESIEILKQAKEIGFKEIVLTPHYIENSKYNKNNEEKEKLLKTLKEKETEIKLYIGNEVFQTENIEELLNKKEIATINNSKYLLIEFPMYQKTIKNINNIIYELKIKGITPIIAHPERYEFIQTNIKIVDSLIEDGAILQSNYGSIIGIYGKNAKKTVKKLLKNNKISLLATDVHYKNNKIYEKMDKIIKKIKKIVGEERLIELIYENPKKIIENKEISES
jgi:protein-tyrosine phosphatase